MLITESDMSRVDRDKIDLLNELGRRVFSKILTHFNIDYIDAGYRVFGKCPIPSHSGDRNNWTSFSFDYNKGIWSCFTHHCETLRGNDVIGFVAAMKNCYFQDAFDWLKEFVEKANNTPLEEISVNYVSNKSKTLVTHKPLPERLISFLNRKHPYLIKRGFSQEVLNKYQVGYWQHLGDFMSQRIIIPVRDFEGRLVGFTGRIIFNKEEWDKKYPDKDYRKWLHGRSYVRNYKNDKFSKSSIVFNLYNTRDYDSIIIVEGPLDGLKLEMAGIYNWGACFGGPLSPVQQYLLLQAGIKKVYLAFDADSAGATYKSKTRKLLYENFEIVDVDLPLPYDIGDLSVSTVKRIFKNV